MYGGQTKLAGGANLQGGMVQTVPAVQVLAIVIGLLILHSVLAGLMWGNVITFSSNDNKVATATVITIAAALLFIYMLFLVTSDSY
jgi:hypothetical protein